MAISKKWTVNDEQGMKDVRAEMARLQGEMQVYEAAKAVGESAYHFRLTRRKPLHKFLAEFEKTERCLVSLNGFDEVVPLYALDENGLSRMEAQPLNFDPRYVFGWSEYEYKIENGVSLRVGFGIEPNQEDDVPRFSVELLCSGNETFLKERKLLSDIPRSAPQKYTHHQLTMAVLKRLTQLEAVETKYRRRR